MNQLVTTAIILSRTDYGEADRILSLLTPQYGKLSLMAKGVRRVKSKLAGGIELFSVSEITFIKGRGAVGTLVSTRLIKHYEHIVGDLNRTMLGYDLIKQLNKVTEDEPEEEYFDLLRETFEALDETSVPIDLIRFWFGLQLLRLNGHTPNMQTDDEGHRLEAGQKYQFNFDAMAFRAHPEGEFGAGHIKLLRLAFEGHSARFLANIQGVNRLTADCIPLSQHWAATYSA
ncbi:MAG TPA: DNA repair protein RecO [Candidatus Saccharimonadales bacterium]|nr:DNA repair protein RecO [Candidatus Saccharimonadales bacterium]